MKKNKYRFIFTLMMLAVYGQINAQTDPSYSHFMYSKLIYNPAYAGNTEGKICFSLMKRATWDNFTGRDSLQVGPGSTGLLFNMSLSTNVEKFISRIGLGFVYTKDVLGIETTQMPKLAFSYKQPLANGGRLTMGLGIGLMQKSLDGNKVVPVSPATSPPVVPIVNGTAMDLDLGLYYTKPNLGIWFEDFYAGFSITHFNQSKINYDSPLGGTQASNKMNFYFITGALYQSSIPALLLQPNISIRKDPANLIADINCNFHFNQNIRAGLSWRTNNSLVLLAGYQFPWSLYLGYSYDFHHSSTVNYSSGLHEIMLRYCFRRTPAAPLKSEGS